MTPMHILLSVMTLPNASRSIPPALAEFKGDDVGINLVQHLQRVLVGLHVLEHALLRGIAPARVTPHLGFRTQAFDRAIEDINAERRIDDIVHDVAHCKQMDLRFFELDDLTACVGEIVQLLVQSIGDSEDAVLQRLVVPVLHGESDQFRSDRAELDRLFGHALRNLEHGGILQFASRNWPADAGHDTRFKIVVKNVAGGKTQAAFAGRSRLRVAIEPAHMSGWIIGPTLAADIGIEMCVAVGNNIQARHFLFVQVDRDRIDILLAELVVHHRVKKAARAKILGVPTRPRQRAGNGGRQHHVFGGAKHDRHLPVTLLSLALVYVDDTQLGNDLRNVMARGMDKTGTAAHFSWAVFMLWQNVCYS